MFDLSDDLASVADGIEAVTLLRRGATAPATIVARALRGTMTASEAAIVNSSDIHKAVAAGGQYVAADVVWHLPAAELAEAPQLGDLILDGDGGRWTILQVRRIAMGADWRCAARNVAIAFRLDDTITVLRMPDGVAAGSTWRTWRTGVRRAYFQPLDTTIQSDALLSSTTARFRIFVEEDLDVDHTCAIRGPDGTIYRITSASGAERIGELQTIETEVTW